MNRIYSILCIALLFVACQREDKSAKLLEDYRALDERVTEEYKQAQTPEQADSIISAYIEEAFALQQAIPESEAAYVILGDLYYMLSMEQREQAFAVLNLDSLAAHDLQRQYNAFCAEKRTAIGQTFTDFVAVTPEGNQLSLSDFVGKSDYLLVDFWASWCGPCRRSMPGLKELLAAHSNLSVLGVSVDNDEDAWKKAIVDLGLTWSQLLDSSEQGSEAYGIAAIPHTILISRDGIIVARNPSHDEIESLLK